MKNNQYHVALPDKTLVGPYDEVALMTQHKTGKYPKGTLVWREGTEEWVLIEKMILEVEKILNDEMVSTSPLPPLPVDCPPNTPPLLGAFPSTPPPPSIPYDFKKEYYVVDYDGNKQGPYSLNELKIFLKKGTFYGSELGWKQGMTDWAPLNDILNIHPVTYYMEPQSWVACSFFCASSILSIVAAIVYRHNDAHSASSVLAGLFLLPASILLLIRLFKAWQVLQNISDRIKIPSPGQAIGLLFVPFFSFYWAFIAFCKVSSIGNKLLKCPGSIQLWPFLTHCILNILGFITMIFARMASNDRAIENWFIFGSIMSIFYTACVIFIIYYINKLIFEYRDSKKIH